MKNINPPIDVQATLQAILKPLSEEAKRNLNCYNKLRRKIDRSNGQIHRAVFGSTQ